MPDHQTGMSGAITTERQDGRQRVVLTGRLGVHQLMLLRAALASHPDGEGLTIDLSDLEAFDTSIAWAIAAKRQQMAAAGAQLRVEGAGTDVQLVLDTVAAAMPQADPPPARAGGPLALLERLGRGVASRFSGIPETLNILGVFLHRLGRSFIRPRSFRGTALVAHCEAVGLQAVPIVALLSFLIGVVLAFQGASQLRQFGAEVFVVDLIAISILRELGILLTAIIVAGRTASSFTSAIGSMKMREEIDAMRTLAIDPVEALVVPRILALVLMLPILGLIADLAGLAGGALMSWIELGISPQMFQVRLLEGTDVSHVWVGLVKAPVFAVIIGVIGCRDGLRVQGTAESLGRMTSSSVVSAVFAVIVTDAIFSIFFAQMGI